MANPYTFSDVVTLIRELESYDAEGRVQITEQRREAYAEVRSVTSRETYAAMAINLSPELKLILPSFVDDYARRVQRAPLSHPARLPRGRRHL